MEATRQIYWNVGHGVIWPMYLLAFAAMGLCAWGFWRRLPVYRLGGPTVRTDRIGQRLSHLIQGALGQAKVLRTLPGFVHALFLWGFLLLFLGTLLVMAQADFTQPLFGLVFLKGAFYKGFSLALDLAGFVAILMLAGLLLRRTVAKPKGLPSGSEDLWVAGLLLAILLTGFVAEGLRMTATELRQQPQLALWSPLGLAFAKGFAGLTEGQTVGLHRLTWWGHFLLSMAFVALIPFTKLRHLFTTSANRFFVDLGPRGLQKTLDFEAEGAEQFGASHIAHLSWKDIFDADACTSCARCQDRCPAAATEKPLSPMKVVHQVGEVAFTRPEASLIETVGTDALWSCTSCYACMEACPADIEQVPKILEMRRHLTLMEGELPGDEVRTAFENTEVNGNPFGMAYATRAEWAADLDLPTLDSGEPFDVLYFVGCYGSFDKRNRKVARDFIALCKAAGVKVGILGKEEKCCGEPMRKLGNEYLYQGLAQTNVELIKASGATQVVTTCPHCFSTLSRDYRDFGLDLPVEHYSSFLQRLLAEGRLKLKAADAQFTYHDSCTLARSLNIVEAPRELLQAAGGEIREMTQHGRDTFCCGAGGGRILAEEKLGSRINEARLGMAAATGAPALVSNCPFCLTMFEDGVKTGGLEGKLQVRDLAEVLAERL